MSTPVAPGIQKNCRLMSEPCDYKTWFGKCYGQWRSGQSQNLVERTNQADLFEMFSKQMHHPLSMAIWEWWRIQDTERHASMRQELDMLKQKSHEFQKAINFLEETSKSQKQALDTLLRVWTSMEERLNLDVQLDYRGKVPYEPLPQERTMSTIDATGPVPSQNRSCLGPLYVIFENTESE